MDVCDCSIESKKSVKEVGADGAELAGAAEDEEEAEGAAVDDVEGLGVAIVESDQNGVGTWSRVRNAHRGAPPSAIRLFSLYSSRFVAKLESLRYSSSDPASETGACKSKVSIPRDESRGEL